MGHVLERRKRERQTQIINFRVSPTVEAQLTAHLDEAAGVTSPDGLARQLMLEGLAQKE